jgi:hypothetical protein
LDRTERPDEAMRWLAEAKAFAYSQADIPRYQREYRAVADARRRLTAELPRDIMRDWRTAFPEQQRSALPPLTFLGGHPRSGTTLLEQVLAANPAIAARDETPAFAREVIGGFLPANAPVRYDAARFAELTTVELNRMRRSYLKRLLEDADGSSTSALQTAAPNVQPVIDKNPSHTAMLPLWLRAFPELRVLVALRDSRDVVLSCFFQNMPLNLISANFLTLAGAARHYADLMKVWLSVRQWEGIPWLETRYEDLVADVENEGRRVTQFLCLKWHPDQARFHETGASQPVNSLTYQDVTQPVYSRSVERWQRYERYLAPVLPALKPFLKAFHYE